MLQKKFIYLMANSADPDQLASPSQLIWIYTVCKGRVYQGSIGQGFNVNFHFVAKAVFFFLQELSEEGPVPWTSKNNLSFIAEQVSHHPPSMYNLLQFRRDFMYVTRSYRSACDCIKSRSA